MQFVFPLRWLLWLVVGSFPRSQYASIWWNRSSRCRWLGRPPFALVQLLQVQGKTQFIHIRTLGDTNKCSSFLGIILKTKGVATNRLYLAMGSSLGFEHASISMYRIPRCQWSSCVPISRWPHLEKSFRKKIELNQVGAPCMQLWVAEMIRFTFGRWENDFLLGDGVLELIGREALQLRFQVDGDLWQIFQFWCRHDYWW